MGTAQIAILCGGLGTRLGDLTAATPKPLLPVGGMPFLDHLLLELGRFGYREIVLLACFEAEQVAHFARHSVAAARFGMTLKVSVEPDRAGTGGALWHARDLLADEFIVLNGDTWLDVNFHRLAALRCDGDTLAAMALRRVDDPARYSLVTFAQGMVTCFECGVADQGAGYINGGVVACSRELLTHLPQTGALEQLVWPQLARSGQLAGLAVHGFFLDIGVPHSFAEAQRTIPARHRRGAVFFDRDGVLNVDHGHVGSRDRFEWMPGAREAVRLVNEAGLYAFVVTNQAGVAKGFYTEDDVLALHAFMQDDLNRAGAHIDAFRYSPYHVDGVVPAYARASDCRKPGPGMLTSLMGEWLVDGERSVLIGDNDSDLAAAAAAGIAAIKYSNGALDDLVRTLL
ncbi:MAG: HAD-IIIA family hydrolase [Alteraurantiacibacter sp.]